MISRAVYAHARANKTFASDHSNNPHIFCGTIPVPRNYKVDPRQGGIPGGRIKFLGVSKIGLSRDILAFYWLKRPLRLSST